MFYLLQSQPNTPPTPDWGMLGVVIAIISLLAAIAIGIAQIKAAQRPRKDIKCLTVSTASLLKVDKRFRGDLQVSFRGEIIDDATSIVLKIYNSGKLPITPGDFIRPIAFLFNEDTPILNAEILSMDPENLGAMISIANNTIELKPLLMNSSDSIVISAIVASFDNQINVDGRVVDVKIIKMETEDSSDEIIINFKDRLQKQVLLMVFTVFISTLSAITGSSEIGSLIRKMLGL